MFKYQTVIRMQYTDAAGVMFFASAFVLAHNCYEAFLEQQAMSLGSIIDDGLCLAPIVHAEGDLRKPMHLSEQIAIEMTLTRIGHSSFELSYAFTNSKGQPAARATTIHAVVDRATNRPIRIPDRLLNVLKAI